MYSETRKINLIEKVLKVSDEDTLHALEKVLKKAKLGRKRKPLPAHDFLGVWNKEDADLISEAINESCEQIHPDDWKKIFVRYQHNNSVTPGRSCYC